MHNPLRDSIEVGGRRARFYEIDGQRVAVCDDARTALRIADAIREEYPSALKLEIVGRLLFPHYEAMCSERDFVETLAAALWETAGLDILGRHDGEGGPRVFDWEQDAGIIRASLLQAYGLTLEQLADAVSYRELAQLMGSVPHDTPLGQALYYRTAKPPKPTKTNREERREFDKRKRFWALRDAEEPQAAASRGEQLNDRANALFAALAGKARE